MLNYFYYFIIIIYCIKNHIYKLHLDTLKMENFSNGEMVSVLKISDIRVLFPAPMSGDTQPPITSKSENTMPSSGLHTYVHT